MLLTISIAGCSKTPVMERQRAIVYPDSGNPVVKPSSAPSPQESSEEEPNTLLEIRDYTVRARTVVNIVADNDMSAFKAFSLFNTAIAATTTSTVTYVNASAVTYSLTTATLIAGSTTGDNLSLGSVTLAGFSDNSLKECGPSHNQKCTVAAIRMYTTGATAGFIHGVDGYGIPVYAGTAAVPTGSVGLTSANATIVQSYTIPGNKNKITLANFPTPTYNVIADVANAGSGSYSMQLVIEYVLGL